MSASRPPGIRLHLGYYRAGDSPRSTGEIRARLPGVSPDVEPTADHAAAAITGDHESLSALRSRVEIRREG
ncbi:MAG: hypothetical protein RIC55_03950 [Pirellulaceae bacterium]